MAYRTPPAGTVDVGRSTIFGNPFRIGSTVNGQLLAGAGSTIPHFETYARERLNTDADYWEAVRSLAGKPLWCPGCGTNSPTCHARVLERLAKELTT